MAIEKRFIAGISVSEMGNPEYSIIEIHEEVLNVAEHEPRRLGNPKFLIDHMTEEQVKHLHLQLGNVLGVMAPTPSSRDQVRQHVIDGLAYEGDHHRLYYLEQIADILGIDNDHEGIPA